MVAVQRLRQGVGALLAFARPLDISLAAGYLTPGLMALFRRMRRGEQLHSLNVLRHVLAQGQTSPDLAAAALLHDVGKARYPFPVWQKTLIVLVRAFSPAVFVRWSEGDVTRWWQRPFVVAVRHPSWSAEDIAAAGGSESLVWLAAHHADPLDLWRDHPFAALLERLQRADDAS